MTGMDTRVGYPNEHLAGDSDESLSSPQYATTVGLLMNGLKKVDKKKAKNVPQKSTFESDDENKGGIENDVKIEEPKEPKKSIFEKWGDKFRDFLDNAE